jgi:Putative phage serine protease XkdF
MELQIYMASVDASLSSDLEVNFIGLVDRPAIDRNFQAFNAQKHKAAFVVDTERRIISGPAMIAEMPLYRKDDQLGEYYVMFDKPAIQTIVEKFSAKGYLQKFNLFHDDQQQVSDVTIFNSFVTDKGMGINPPTGFEDAAEGSWFISAKVNNDAVWARVKEGVIKGFSVEGLFSYLPMRKTKMTKEDALQKIEQLLNGTLLDD